MCPNVILDLIELLICKKGLLSKIKFCFERGNSDVAIVYIPEQLRRMGLFFLLLHCDCTINLLSLPQYSATLPCPAATALTRLGALAAGGTTAFFALAVALENLEPLVLERSLVSVG